jgi:hypothetical protein
MMEACWPSQPWSRPTAGTTHSSVAYFKGDSPLLPSGAATDLADRGYFS